MLHFIQGVDYERKSNKFILKKYAVPSIFSHGTNSQEVEVDTCQIETTENVENVCQTEIENSQTIDLLRKEIESMKKDKTMLRGIISRQSKELENMRKKMDDDFVEFALNRLQDDLQV